MGTTTFSKEPITPEKVREMRRFVAKFGPGNCWTGTVGTACGYIHTLLNELGYDDDGQSEWEVK